MSFGASGTLLRGWRLRFTLAACTSHHGGALGGGGVGRVIVASYCWRQRNTKSEGCKNSMIIFIAGLSSLGQIKQYHECSRSGSGGMNTGLASSLCNPASSHGLKCVLFFHLGQEPLKFWREFLAEGSSAMPSACKRLSISPAWTEVNSLNLD